MNTSADISQKNDEELFATFFLDGQEFAINVEYVQDAIPLTENIVAIPTGLNFLKGIINLRENIIPIVDTRKRFQIDNGNASNVGHVAITMCQGRYMGMTFDQINEVIRVKTDQIDILPPGFQTQAEVLPGVIKLEGGTRLIQIINPSSVVKADELPEHLLRQTISANKNIKGSKRRQAVTFYLGEELFGANIEQVREIIMVPEINQRVLVEEYLRGVISLRGELISIMDLGVFLGEEKKELTPEHRIIILTTDKLTVGVLVDGIKEVLTFDEDTVLPMPDLSLNKHGRGFSGMVERSDKHVIMINFDEMLRDIAERIKNHLQINDQSGQAGSGLHETDGQGKAKHGEIKTYITFEIGEIYGVDISHVQEIVRVTGNIHHLPGQADYVQGIISLRSEVIPVISLRRYLKKEETSQGEGMILILTWQDIRVGILIDRLLEIAKVAGREEKDMPKIMLSKVKKTLHEIVDRVVELQDHQGNTYQVIMLDVGLFVSTLTAVDGDLPNQSTEYSDVLGAAVAN